jgi:hypothetical protein
VRAAQVVLISAIAHAPLLLYVAGLTAPVPRSRRVGVPPGLPLHVVPAPPAPAPTTAIEIAFLVDEPSDGAQRGVAVGATARTKSPRIGTSTSTTTSTSTSTSTSDAAPAGSARRDDGGAGSSLMRMRGADLDLAPGVAERIAAASPVRPDERRKSGKLESQPGGRAIVHDRVTTMTVDPDGKVHFDDKKDIDPRFKLPIPKLWEVENMRRDLGHELTEWFKDPEAGKRFGTSSDLPRHLQASPGACDSWGAAMCDDPLAPEIEKRVRERKKVNGGFLGGPMDITAWLHRKFVGDPYSSRKLKLLADTLDERVAMGEAHRAQQRARSAEYMRRNVEQLWAREPNPVARRAALFELWDECGEDEAGARARAIVIGWIRARLPAGSEHAYTDAELAALQEHRTSSLPFAPYAD